MAVFHTNSWREVIDLPLKILENELKMENFQILVWKILCEAFAHVFLKITCETNGKFSGK
eukprot:TRINITY_DN12829_c0_g1_i1.p2 TRINITY_DN12829_c0_g1~~TRINITY_DN12829_c0_g1_i1.p2  ORF type:complete len:60 (+),score=19.66 TRINITY_DN12829_c0_g1_i1:204-383(+)